MLRKGPALAIAARPDGPDDRLQEDDQVAVGFVGDGSAESDLRLVTGWEFHLKEGELAIGEHAQRNPASRLVPDAAELRPVDVSAPVGRCAHQARAGPSRANIWRYAVSVFTARGRHRACAGGWRYPENVRIVPP